MAVVLSLDVATLTGWAVMRSDRSIRSGRVRLPKGERQGERLHAFRKWLTTKKAEIGHIDFVVYENAAFQRGAANEVFHNLIGVLLDWCEHHLIGYAKINPTSIKTFATGKGNADKAAMLQAAAERGYQCIDDNEADAILLLLFVVKHNPQLLEA